MKNDAQGAQAARPRISAYIIACNEERIIARALESVRWMDEIVVLDSGSTDDTVTLAKKYGARIAVEAFKSFVHQKNRAMELCTGDWLFNLDADEEVTPELRSSIESAVNKGHPVNLKTIYDIRRRTFYLGRWMRHCGWYPEYRARLSQRGHAAWRGEVLHERLVGDGPEEFLEGDLLHRPYENLGDHLTTIARYSELWAGREASRGRKINRCDLVMRPLFRFFKMYVFKFGVLDGIQGLIASMMGAWYVFLKYARLFEISRIKR